MFILKFSHINIPVNETEDIAAKETSNHTKISGPVYPEFFLKPLSYLHVNYPGITNSTVLTYPPNIRI